MDQLPRLGKRELICLLLFTCNYVVSVWRDFLFLLVLGMGYVILLWLSLSLPLIILQSMMNMTYHFVYILKDHTHPTSLRASLFSKTARPQRKASFCAEADHAKLAQ